MAISAKDVMELRKQTDCGMMECKKALTEADGNFEKAIEILRERGLATAAKKASRVAAEGMVYADYCPKCKVGVVIEVNAETDFVAKNDKFVDFVKEATKVVMLQNPADVEALMACKTETGETVDEALKNLILVIKENIKIRRFVRYEGVCSALRPRRRHPRHPGQLRDHQRHRQQGRVHCLRQGHRHAGRSC